MPMSGHEAMEHSQCAKDHTDTYLWKCPDGYGSYYSECIVLPEDLESSFYEDFRRSMERDCLRVVNGFNPNPYIYVENDKYVRFFAQAIDNCTQGLDAVQKATAYLWFVNSCISYTSDTELYGCDDYVAFPLETLYLRSGDCEDKSILLCALLNAAGYDTVLVDFIGHMSCAVRLGGMGEGLNNYALSDGSYYYCEASSNVLKEIGGTPITKDEPRIWKQDSNSILDSVQSLLASYRNLIWRTVRV